MTEQLLEVNELRTHLKTPNGLVKAVDGLDFTVKRGETLCLVGESGSGKTMTCDTIARLLPRHATVSGEIRFDGTDLLQQTERQLRSIRGNRIAYVFQNARGALDPVYTIGQQIVEAITLHSDLDKKPARSKAVDLLETVGLSRSEARLDEYPHQLSDGMAQRVTIAMALSADPDLLIADEPTSALDVTIQAKIVALLDRLRKERELSLLLVTHNLRVVAALADRVVILHRGTALEHGMTNDVFAEPAHPYTQDLFRSFVGETGGEQQQPADSSTTGCPYAPECPHRINICETERPAMVSVSESENHEAACVFYESGRDAAEVRPTGRFMGDWTDDVKEDAALTDYWSEPATNASETDTPRGQGSSGEGEAE